jgi:hypothetical protein
MNFKFRSILFLLVLPAIHVAEAGKITDFVGSWKGTRTEIVDGEKVTARQSVTFRLFQSKGIKGTSKISFPGAGTVTAYGTYYPSGEYEATAYLNGDVLGISTGTWQFSGKTLSVIARTESTSGSVRGKATQRLVGKNQYVFVSTTSNGKVTGTFRRK